MDSGSDWCRQARLADAKMLYSVFDSSITGGTNNLWLQKMRNLIQLCDGNVLLLGRGEFTEEKASAANIMLAGIQIIDADSRRALIHTIYHGTKIDSIFMEKLLNYSFYSLDLYRLEMLMPADKAEDFSFSLEKQGWYQESILKKAQYFPDMKIHTDVMMYVILRPQDKSRGAAFVIFDKGLFAIYGTEEYLLETAFAHFNQSLGTGWQQEAAEILGLLDEKGRLKKAKDIKKYFQDSVYCAADDLPAMVKIAAAQAGEYFTGHRKEFQLEYSLSKGSPFQIKVWQALADIPYGATWSYEEMAAYIIEDQDRKKARNLSRAVGSACAANPISLFLPCHRVIGKDGKLIGFGGGLDVKEYLLEHEMFGF